MAEIVASIGYLLFALVLCAIPTVVALGIGPPERGSWWYPDPDRWDYRLKLRLYATWMPAEWVKQPGGWIIRLIALIILAGTLWCIWGWALGA